MATIKTLPAHKAVYILQGGPTEDLSEAAGGDKMPWLCSSGSFHTIGFLAQWKNFVWGYNTTMTTANLKQNNTDDTIPDLESEDGALEP